MSTPTEWIWRCKIGGNLYIPSGVDEHTRTAAEAAFKELIPSGGDLRMRIAVEAAFKEIIGAPSAFLFSGWDGHLTEPERAVHENREPNDKFREDWHAIHYFVEAAKEQNLLVEAVMTFGECRAAGDTAAAAILSARREWDLAC